MEEHILLFVPAAGMEKLESFVNGRIYPRVTIRVHVVGRLNFVYQEQSYSESLSVEKVATTPYQVATEPEQVATEPEQMA